jgi:hypothetical protein
MLCGAARAPYPRWVKAGIAGASFVAVAAGLALGLSGAGGSDSRAPTPTELTALRADALAFAEANGERAPDGGVFVSGKRRDVISATMGGAEVGTSQDVFVVRLHGDFVGYAAPRPAGVSPPHGHYLEIVFDAETEEMTDWSISGQPQDLSRFSTRIPVGP